MTSGSGNLTLFDAVKFLKRQIHDSSSGLPDEIFYFVSSITPLVNVDLLIRDENGRTLLAWRDDLLSGTGWHVPGGIVRHKETFETRVQKVAEAEIGALITFAPQPIALHQLFNTERDVRGHFISLLFQCFLSSSFVPSNNGLSCTDMGFLQWHETCPDNLLKCQDVYVTYINSGRFQEKSL